MNMKAGKVVAFCAAALIVLIAAWVALTLLKDDAFEATSEFSINTSHLGRDGEMDNGDALCGEIFNTYLPRWRSEDFMDRIIRQYRADYPHSTVNDRELREVLAGAELKREPRSRWVTIAVRSKSPELVAALANAYAEAIESFSDEENLERCKRTDNLEAEKDILKQSLRKAKEDVLEFEKRVRAASEWVRVLLAVQKAPENADELPAKVPRSSELAAAYTKLQTVKTELATLQTHDTSLHPAVVSKERKRREAEAEFVDVVERALRTAQGDREACQEQLKHFRWKCEELKKRIAELDQKRVRTDADLRALDVGKSVSGRVYQGLLRKENEVRLAAESSNVIIRVERRAQIPNQPTGASAQVK